VLIPMEAHISTLPWVASDCKRLLGHRFEQLLAEASIGVLIGKTARGGDYRTGKQGSDA
jgi:hypothetical protein